jgi:putative N6-adenine-specific DNA methylase
MKLVAKTYAGLEDYLEKELYRIGAEDITKVRRGVLFNGNTEVLYKANYLLRTALRILVNIKTGSVKDEDALYDLIYNIPWEDYFNVKQTFSVDSVVTSDKFTHSQYVALKTKDAIVDRFRRKFHKRPNVNRIQPDIKVSIFINRMQCIVSLDSSGDSLHKRNYKIHQIEAPLSEVLAAGMLKMVEYTGEQDLLDPMCGSGTLGLEAYMVKRNIPAGYFRDYFCFKQWSHFKPEIWDKVVAEANAEIVDDWGGKIICRDKQMSSIRKTEQNFEPFEQFGLDNILFKRKDFLRSEGQGELLIVINPPYDDKLEVDDILGFYQDIGTRLKHKFVGSTAWILSGHMDALKFVGLSTSKRIELFNGPIPVKFMKYELYQGSKK